MDERVRAAYLYDFYGELLNERQRQAYEAYFLDDLTLSEIAEQTGISRQGVSDLARRSAKKLQEYEKKLHLLSQFLSISADAEEIGACAKQIRKNLFAEEEIGSAGRTEERGSGRRAKENDSLLLKIESLTDHIRKRL